ncbi:MAG: thioredoxin fold domain-containing protein [Desulfobacteraceae bacterium]|nr:thioredoxin fold domain-containing protein [Desulfobacteraceae bacterium]MBC2718074.1 thioredoxin fold domain-containing protein [Desulfobacteraceae bacterium]
MKKTAITICMYSLFVFLFFCVITNNVFSEDFKSIPVKGMVTMLDLGAKQCLPCKMMVPILEKMEKNYKGKAAIIFIDVWKNRDQAGKFGIRAIPTQIFFNKEGKEVYRHVGFMGETAIIKQLKKMGVPKERGRINFPK